eukprot:7109592-Lingulodinium_polyedra.AAC.2
MSSSMADPAATGAEDLLRAINAARPICRWWNTARGCRKGRKCPNRHLGAGEQEHDAHLPHISRWRDADGNDHITLRPPFKQALVAFFSQAGRPVTVGTGVQHGDKVTYDLINFVAPKRAAIANAENMGAVEVTLNDGR